MRYQKLFAAALLSATLFSFGSGPALAQLSAVNFTDVPAEHWAAQAVKDLVDKYGVMQGFPDKTFRGTRNISRFEAAAAFLRIMDQLAQTEELTKRIGKVALEDLKTLRTLNDEFKQEIESKDLSIKIEVEEYKKDYIKVTTTKNTKFLFSIFKVLVPDQVSNSNVMRKE